MHIKEVRQYVDSVQEQALKLEHSTSNGEIREIAQHLYVVGSTLNELIDQMKSLGGFNAVGTGEKINREAVDKAETDAVEHGADVEAHGEPVSSGD